MSSFKGGLKCHDTPFQGCDTWESGESSSAVRENVPPVPRLVLLNREDRDMRGIFEPTYFFGGCGKRNVRWSGMPVTMLVADEIRLPQFLILRLLRKNDGAVF